MKSDISNGKFEEKKKIYRQSEIMITKSLSNYREWKVDDIEKRRKEFAEKALKIWNLEV